jgi:hypothetical protein
LVVIYAIAAIFILYMISSVVIFDYTEYAAPDLLGEEYRNGKVVMCGPRPRIFIPGNCSKFDIPGGPSYYGNEWPFIAYRPMCYIFVKMKGGELN